MSIKTTNSKKKKKVKKQKKQIAKIVPNNIESTENTEIIKNVDNIGDIENIENIENTKNIENIENTENSENTENTDSTDNNDNNDNNDNTDNNDNSDNNENTENINNTGKTNNTEIIENTEHNEQIIEYIKTLHYFADVDSKTYIPTTKKTLLDLLPIEDLINNDYANTHIKIIGSFKINYSSQVIIGQDNSDESLHLQLVDLPFPLWYKIKNTSNLQSFLQCYSTFTNYADTNIKTTIKTVNYRLTTNNICSIMPITMERYIFLSNFTNHIACGFSIDIQKVMELDNEHSAFDMACAYGNILQQREEIFEISTVTKYSNSCISIKIASCGVAVVRIDYIKNVSENGYSDIIRAINNEIESDMDVDLPIDVVLFLLPFSPVGIKYIMNMIEIDELELNLNTVYLIRLLINVDANKIDRKLIEIMRSLYKKLEKIEKNEKMENTTNNDDVKNAIKNYVTRDYIKFVVGSVSGSITTKARAKKVVETIIEKMKKDKNETFIDRPYLKNIFGK